MTNHFSNIRSFSRILMGKPFLTAKIKGSSEFPHITGKVNFYPSKSGVLVASEIAGLPHSEGACNHNIFAFHIHGGKSCTGTAQDPFADALTHYNPESCDHPFHAGDLPPLFENDGYAFSVFLTNRFRLQEIVEKTVIIHGMPDDFTSQPAGNAGKKLACGVIEKNYCVNI